MPYGSELKECSEFSNAETTLFCETSGTKISIFWSVLTFGTSPGILSGTELNEESDKEIRFYICSIITSQFVVKVSRSKFAFFSFSKLLKNVFLAILAYF